MTATAHALVSGAIVSVLPNPTISLPLAFASHFILDTVPHWDFGTNWRSRAKFKTGIVAILDTIIGFTLAYFLFAGKVDTWVIIAACALGNLPDWLEAPYYIFFAQQNSHAPSADANFWEKLTYTIYKKENVFHTKAEFPFGIYTQVATVLFFFLITRVI